MGVPIGQQLKQKLIRFEEQTEGILTSSVIESKQALLMAQGSKYIDETQLQGVSVQVIRAVQNALEALIDNAIFESVTIQETEHVIYIRPVNADYYVVVVSDKSDTPGLREYNLKKLILELNVILS